MKERPKLGLWRYILNVPPFMWRKQMARAKRRFEREYDALSDEARRVHHFAVQELPAAGGPLRPDVIAERLGIDARRIDAILDDLERRMVYLYRNESGEVTWAYPVTVAETPHRITFDTGEQLYAA